MNSEQFNAMLSNIPNDELIEKAKNIVSKLCETGGRSFTMTVPVRLDDTDIILSELIRRFEQYEATNGN